MAFDRVLLHPESASFAGQAGLSHSLAYQNTPERVLDPFPSQRPQVSPPVGKPEWPAPAVSRSTAGHWGLVRFGPGQPSLDAQLSMGIENGRVLGTESVRVGPMVEAWATVFRPAVFPWPAHTVQWHPMSSISIRRISHLSRTRALTHPIPTRYHCCCFHSLGGEEEVARGPRRPGSGPAMGSRSPGEEERIFGAIPVAGQVLSRSRRAVRVGAAGPAPQRVVKGSQPTQCMTLGLARGSGPFEPPAGESSPLAPPSPPPLPSPSPLTGLPAAIGRSSP